MRWPNSDEELSVKIVIMSDDTADKGEAIRCARVRGQSGRKGLDVVYG
jgi:hypothetical protein